ncbi:MAG: hypothetical protein ABSD29_12910 [Verrucomicrobiota bacterium]|jgi:hypothetical protein
MGRTVFCKPQTGVEGGVFEDGNGPGEMADADFGCVGGAPGKINLYVGKTAAKFNIPETSGRPFSLYDVEHVFWFRGGNPPGRRPALRFNSFNPWNSGNPSNSGSPFKPAFAASRIL